MITYYLYKLTNPNDDTPKYIGITNNVEKRLIEHILDTHDTKKTRWISELKSNNLLPEIKIIGTTTSIEELKQMEIDTISEFKNIYELVNSTNGGEYLSPSPIDVFDMNGVYLDSYSSMKEYCDICNNSIRLSHISDVCLRKRNSTNGYIFRYSGDVVTVEDLKRLNLSREKNQTGNSNPHKLIVMDIEGNVIATFNSGQEASDAGFGSPGQILSCVNHPEKQTLCKGYLICNSIDEYPKRILNYLHNKQHNPNGNWICQYDLDGNYISRYVSINQASEVAGTNSGIAKCLETNKGKSGNFQWRYSDNKNNITPYKKTYNTINRYKPVYQYTKDDIFIKKFNSCEEAALEIKGNAKYIRSAAQGLKKSAYKYIWKYTAPFE